MTGAQKAFYIAALVCLCFSVPPFYAAEFRLMAWVIVAVVVFGLFALLV